MKIWKWLLIIFFILIVAIGVLLAIFLLFGQIRETPNPSSTLSPTTSPGVTMMSSPSEGPPFTASASTETKDPNESVSPFTSNEERGNETKTTRFSTTMETGEPSTVTTDGLTPTSSLQSNSNTTVTMYKPSAVSSEVTQPAQSTPTATAGGTTASTSNASTLKEILSTKKVTFASQSTSANVPFSNAAATSVGTPTAPQCVDCQCNGGICIYNVTVGSCQCKCQDFVFGDTCSFGENAATAHIETEAIPIQQASFTLQIDILYDRAFNNLSSPESAQFINTLERELEVLCKEAEPEGYKTVKITKLLRGSVIAEGVAQYSYKNNESQIHFVNTQLEHELTGILNDSNNLHKVSLAFGNSSVWFNKIILEPPPIANLLDLEPYINCSHFANYTAVLNNGQWQCVGPCETRPGYCHHHGDCLNDINKGSICRCYKSSREQFYGPQCEHSMSLLTTNGIETTLNMDNSKTTISMLSSKVVQSSSIFMPVSTEVIQTSTLYFTDTKEMHTSRSEHEPSYTIRPTSETTYESKTSLLTTQFNQTSAVHNIETIVTSTTVIPSTMAETSATMNTSPSEVSSMRTVTSKGATQSTDVPLSKTTGEATYTENISSAKSTKVSSPSTLLTTQLPETVSGPNTRSGVTSKITFPYTSASHETSSPKMASTTEQQSSALTEVTTTGQMELKESTSTITTNELTSSANMDHSKTTFSPTNEETSPALNTETSETEPSSTLHPSTNHGISETISTPSQPQHTVKSEETTQGFESSSTIRPTSETTYESKTSLLTTQFNQTSAVHNVETIVTSTTVIPSTMAETSATMNTSPSEASSMTTVTSKGATQSTDVPLSRTTGEATYTENISSAKSTKVSSPSTLSQVTTQFPETVSGSNTPGNVTSKITFPYTTVSHETSAPKMASTTEQQSSALTEVTTTGQTELKESTSTITTNELTSSANMDHSKTTFSPTKDKTSPALNTETSETEPSSTLHPSTNHGISETISTPSQPQHTVKSEETTQGFESSSTIRPSSETTYESKTSLLTTQFNQTSAVHNIETTVTSTTVIPSTIAETSATMNTSPSEVSSMTTVTSKGATQSTDVPLSKTTGEATYTENISSAKSTKVSSPSTLLTTQFPETVSGSNTRSGVTSKITFPYTSVSHETSAPKMASTTEQQSSALTEVTTTGQMELKESTSTITTNELTSSANMDHSKTTFSPTNEETSPALNTETSETEPSSTLHPSTNHGISETISTPSQPQHTVKSEETTQGFESSSTIRPTSETTYESKTSLLTTQFNQTSAVHNVETIVTSTTVIPSTMAETSATMNTSPSEVSSMRTVTSKGATQSTDVPLSRTTGEATYTENISSAKSTKVSSPSTLSQVTTQFPETVSGSNTPGNVTSKITFPYTTVSHETSAPKMASTTEQQSSALTEVTTTGQMELKESTSTITTNELTSSANMDHSKTTFSPTKDKTSPALNTEISETEPSSTLHPSTNHGISETISTPSQPQHTVKSEETTQGFESSSTIRPSSETTYESKTSLLTTQFNQTSAVHNIETTVTSTTVIPSTIAETSATMNTSPSEVSSMRTVTSKGATQSTDVPLSKTTGEATYTENISSAKSTKVSSPSTLLTTQFPETVSGSNTRSGVTSKITFPYTSVSHETSAPKMASTSPLTTNKLTPSTGLDDSKSTFISTTKFYFPSTLSSVTPQFSKADFSTGPSAISQITISHTSASHETSAPKMNSTTEFPSTNITKVIPTGVTGFQDPISNDATNDLTASTSRDIPSMASTVHKQTTQTVTGVPSSVPANGMTPTSSLQPNSNATVTIHIPSSESSTTELMQSTLAATNTVTTNGNSSHNPITESQTASTFKSSTLMEMMSTNSITMDNLLTSVIVHLTNATTIPTVPSTAPQCTNCQCNGNPCIYNDTLGSCQCQCQNFVFGISCSSGENDTFAYIDSEALPTRKANLTLEINIDFKDAFNNLSSNESIEFLKRLEPELEGLCREANPQAYRTVEVIKLSRGSVVAESLVQYNYQNNETVIQFLNTQFQQVLTDFLNDTNNLQRLSQVFGNKSVSLNALSFLPPPVMNIMDLRPFINCSQFANYTAEISNDQWLCVGPCKTNPYYCHQHGECINDIYRGPLCKCYENSMEQYYGPRCEFFRRGPGFYGALFGSLAAAVLLLIIIVIAVIAIRRHGNVWKRNYPLNRRLSFEEDFFDFSKKRLHQSI